MATGYSCRSQVKLVDNRRLLHPIQVVRSLLSAALPTEQDAIYDI
ncbi:hypothetical protein QO002_000425 [Pararhizobium capsulatum DSM 1112]|uniref:Transposase n=1 Tax=Pararhizobium capsulatum DSM 1112 TaxID=1121113 RepID=A0ABU0BJV0_9HYPH|nr:hypothetical protein [Pararhizobium capsulatum DSM 1112]